MKRILSLLAASVVALATIGQTLGVGDIAIIGYSNGGDVGWTFVTLADIPISEEIYFTDQGWINGQWGTGTAGSEDHVLWTAPHDWSIGCGTVIHIAETSSDAFSATLGTASIAPGSSGFALSAAGDQLLAYRGGSGPEPTTPVFLAGVNVYYNASNYNATTTWADGGTNSNRYSDLPLGLTNGVNCISLANSTTAEFDYCKFSGALTGETSAARTNINTVANWTQSNTLIDISAGQYSSTLDCIPTLAEWEGGVSNQWDNLNNWNRRTVPTSTHDVLIPASASTLARIEESMGTISIEELEIESGATLELRPGAALTVNDTATVNGTLWLRPEGSAALPTNHASFIENGWAGSGTCNTRRRMLGSGGATPDSMFWYFSSPLPDAQSSAVLNATVSPNAIRLWEANEPTFSYPEILVGTETLNPGEGYIARGGGSVEINFFGSSFNTGTVSVTGLTRTGTTNSNRGYNLVGNPFPSAIDWDNAVTTNLEPTIWYRTHASGTANMLFDTYNSVSMLGTSNNGTAVDGVIQTTQAFWVRVSGDGLTGQVDFTHGMRLHSPTDSYLRVAEEQGVVRLRISNGTVSDEQILYFDSEASNGFDDFDSHKFWGSASIPQIYTNIGEDTLTINGMNSMATNPVIDLGLKLPTAGSYSLDATGITLNETVLLEDRLLNVFQDLNAEPNYTFTSVAGNIGDRFALHVAGSVTGLEEDVMVRQPLIYVADRIANLILKEPAQLNGIVQVIDMTGQIITERPVQSQQTRIDLSQTASGVYIVQVLASSGRMTRKVVLQ